MNNFIYNKKYFYECRGNVFSFSHQDEIPAQGITGKSVNICVVDAQPQIIVVPKGDSVAIDNQISNYFHDDFVVQQEYLQNNKTQIIGIRKDIIRGIYKKFENYEIIKLIPYQIAIRAYLKFIDVEHENQCVVFIDSCEDSVLITFINEGRVSPTRVIADNGTRNIATEVKRSLQNYKSREAQDGQRLNEFVFACSDSQIYENLLSAQIADTDSLIVIKDRCPALIGLQEGRFGMHYLLPELIVKQAQRAALLKTALTFLVCLVTTALSAGFMKYTTLNHKKALDDLNQAKSRHIQIKKQLEHEYERKYPDILQHLRMVDFANVYLHFIDNQPEGYRIEKTEFYSDENLLWTFEASIFLNEDSNQTIPFLRKGIFEKATVDYITFQSTQGQKVTLPLIGDNQ